MLKKVLVIGLDGATFDIIKPLLISNSLPNIKRLIDNGVSSILNSTIPPMSPSAWTSFMTGKNPGKHGIFDFTQRDYKNYRNLITSRSHESTLWGILSHYNERVCVVNVPQTYPPEKVNGVMVTGLGTPSNHGFTHPIEIAEQLFRNGYKIDTEVQYKNGQEDVFLDSIFNVSAILVTESVKLIQQEIWDFSMVVLRLTDEIPHFFWRYMDSTHPLYTLNSTDRWQNAIFEAYKKADIEIGELISAANADIVFIMSDHGFGPLHKDVYLNTWLLQQGWLNLRNVYSPISLMSTILRRVGFTRSNVGRTLSKVRLGWLRAWLRQTLGTRANLIPNDNRRHVSDLVDWQRTQAYSMGYIGQIYINVQGRDPQGIVRLGDDYEDLCRTIVKELRDWKHPEDGLPVVDQVFLKHEIWNGKHVPDAPDIFVIMRGLTYITRESYDWPQNNEMFVVPPTGESAAHRIEGILIVAGDGIRQGEEVEKPNIIDLAPTILHLMGHPVPNDMDGRILFEIFQETSSISSSGTTTDPIHLEQDHSGLTEDEAKLVEERLRGLGYLD